MLLQQLQDHPGQPTRGDGAEPRPVNPRHGGDFFEQRPVEPAGVEGMLTCQALVEDDAQAEQVTPWVEGRLLPHDGLAHLRDVPPAGAGLFPGLPASHGFGVGAGGVLEVDNLGRPVRGDEDVGGL